MSSHHAYFDARDQLAPASARLPLNAIASLRAPVRRAVSHLVAGFRRRRIERDMAHFPDRLLADMGFERDWDGSIAPIIDGKDTR